MNILQQYIIEVLNELEDKSLVYIRVGSDIITNKPYFTEILSSISDFSRKAGGKMENARKISTHGKNEWTYVVSFPNSGRQKRFMDELKKLHPELEIKIPEKQ